MLTGVLEELREIADKHIAKLPKAGAPDSLALPNIQDRDTSNFD